MKYTFYYFSNIFQIIECTSLQGKEYISYITSFQRYTHVQPPTQVESTFNLISGQRVQTLQFRFPIIHLNIYFYLGCPH